MTPINWRTADWLAPLDDVDEHRRGQHERALAILDDYERTARPFALLLSTYHAGQLYGEDQDGYGEITLANILGKHLNDRGVEVICVQDQSDVLASATGVTSLWWRQAIAALRLTDARWLDAVRELARRAEIIVCECQFLTPGLQSELTTCVTVGRVDRTIVLLPVSPPFESLDDSELVASFPRAVHADEVDWKSPLAHFVFHDLVERVASIASLPPDERIALARAAELEARFPIAVGDLFLGFETLAATQQKAGRMDRVVSCYSRLTHIARQSGDDRFIAAYLTQYSQARLAIGDFKGGMDCVLEAERLLENVESKSAAPDGVLTAERVRQWKKDIVLNPAQAFLEKNQTAEVLEFLGELLQPIRKWRDRGLEALCLSKWAEAQIRERRIEDALATIDRVLALAYEAGDRFREAFAIYLRGTALHARDDESGAAAAYNDALQQLPRPGVYEVEWAIFMNLGRIVERRGDREKAHAMYAAAEACADALKDPSRRATATAARVRLEPIDGVHRSVSD